MQALRLTDTPIISPSMLPDLDGHNINGPSIIAAPDWIPGRLGQFYLYFAHHKGDYIRLAYANDLKGPWQIHQTGSLRLDQTPGCHDHIASPDVHVDDDRKEIRMYFHGMELGSRRQRSFLAISKNGIDFEADKLPIADFYLRAAPWRGGWLGMSKGGVMYLSRTGRHDFMRLPAPAFPMRDPQGNAAGDVRHVALKVVSDTLEVYFTRIGDAPERIFRARIDLGLPPDHWKAGEIELILAPETQAEGANYPLLPSLPGPAKSPENAVRDPYIFCWSDKTYLLYSVAGESGIGIADIIPGDENAR